MKTKILDCTIRDGGHLNKWQFDIECVKASYYAAIKSGIDYFEIGYRFSQDKKDIGLFGYCEDTYLKNNFSSSDHCKMAVMIDAGKSTSSLFEDYNPEITPISVVRIASYPYELSKAFNLVEEIRGKGYEVFLNLMASSELSDKEYDLLASWNNKEMLSSVYFADSFGSFIPDDVSILINKLKNVGFNRIGFHSHNNLQLAFANTLRAIEDGVVCVDASIYGMGRGSGNLPIEILLGYLEKSGHKEYNTVPYIDVIDRFFIAMFRKIGWGYSLESLMSGLANIHPYYAENLFKNKLYTIEEIWNALGIIKELCPISFSPTKLDETLEKRFYTPLTTERANEISQSIANQLNVIPANDAIHIDNFELQGKYRGKKFIIIATGPSIIQYRDKILEFKNQQDCIAIGVNHLQGLFTPEFHMFVSRKRFLQYAGHVSKKSQLLIPAFFGTDLVESNFPGIHYYFNVVAPCNPGMPPLLGATQYCLSLNVAISSILTAYLMGASEIYAVGMDGYVNEFDKKMVYFYNEDSAIDDKEIANFRYELLVKELGRISSFLNKESVPFSIITPTSHKKYYRSNYIS
jgi:4-hydroxy 2-oxovalerate aldolase